MSAFTAPVWLASDDFVRFPHFTFHNIRYIFRIIEGGTESAFVPPILSHRSTQADFHIRLPISAVVAEEDRFLIVDCGMWYAVRIFHEFLSKSTVFHFFQNIRAPHRIPETDAEMDIAGKAALFTAEFITGSMIVHPYSVKLPVSLPSMAKVNSVPLFTAAK